MNKYVRPDDALLSDDTLSHAGKTYPTVFIVECRESHLTSSAWVFLVHFCEGDTG